MVDPHGNTPGEELEVAVSQSEQLRTPQQQALQMASRVGGEGPCEGVCVAGPPRVEADHSLQVDSMLDGSELLFKQRRQHGNYRVRFGSDGARVFAQVVDGRKSSAFDIAKIEQC